MNSAACWLLIVTDAPSARRFSDFSLQSLTAKTSHQQFSQSSILNFIFLSEYRDTLKKSVQSFFIAVK